ncbi:MAG: MFS transporter [Pseudomonadota bacterium]
MNTSISDNQISAWRAVLSAPVIIAALGYFVDIYDLLLFSIVRIPSLQSLGLEGQHLTDQGLFLLNVQMAGLLIGGVLWGILGDKIGRLKILFGSIFLYSTANLLNGFVQNVPQYAILRFIAGVGLAGELGAGITLVLESLPNRLRGYGTMVVAGVGVAGAILAGIIAQHFDWRISYFIGGGLGFLLLFLRIGVHESGMFREMESASHVKRGDFLSLFTNWKRFTKYTKSIMVALPLWYSVGILMTLSPEFGKVLGITTPISAGDSIMGFYLGLVIGDFASGALSQWIESRRKVIILFITVYAFILGIFLFFPTTTATSFYVVCALMGIACGYWAIFVTSAAEQFGTNIRATVASTAPNFIRGTVIPITFFFQLWKEPLGFVGSALAVGVICTIIAFVCAWRLEETYGKDLNYVEEK